MKELSTEKKAKAYDEAISRAKKFYTPDSNNVNLKATLKMIFPELKESEDEEIKGAIIHFISHTPAVPKGVIDKETMIAWLEKQGEHVSEDKMTISKEWFEHCKKSWYNEGYIDGKYNRDRQFEEPVSEDLEEAANEWDAKASFTPFYMGLDDNGNPNGVRQDYTTHAESFKAGAEWQKEHHQAEKDVAESFARIIRGNLSMIDKSVQDKFEQLYIDITGGKMYNGFKD